MRRWLLLLCVLFCAVSAPAQSWRRAVPRQSFLSTGENHIEVPGGKGSHRRLFNPETKTTIVVPYHCKDLKKGTELAILKQAGLK